MNSVFVGGSRRIAKLPEQIHARLENLITGNARILVGDANGADKAAQRYFATRKYGRVTVYCSGDTCRNNEGNWETRKVLPSRQAKGFHFYAAKDRKMAKAADFGLMIWDGKSAGTALNVLRLVRGGKKAVLYDIPNKKVLNIKSVHDWNVFLSQRTKAFTEELRARATKDEWLEPRTEAQPVFLEPSLHGADNAENPPPKTNVLAEEINSAIATGNPSAVVDALGKIARDQGMTQLAKETGLARESLYRALSASGNPEFSTIFRVLNSLGLKMRVDEAA